VINNKDTINVKDMYGHPTWRYYMEDMDFELFKELLQEAFEFYTSSAVEITEETIDIKGNIELLKYNIVKNFTNIKKIFSINIYKIVECHNYYKY